MERRPLSLFLDIDGTLLQFAPSPDAVHVPDSLPPLLNQLGERLHGRLAIVSGRPVEQIRTLFPTFRGPALGHHGLEIDGFPQTGSEIGSDPSQIRTLLDATAVWARGRTGVEIEDKGIAYAVHYRKAPHARPEVLAHMQAILEGHEDRLELIPGKCIVELRPSGSNKGTAIRAAMRDAIFSRGSPVFLGDDVTDEAGFRVINALQGISVKVGPGDTAAQWRIASVEAVHVLLEGLVRGIAV